jgi:hypothetical protein
MLPGCARPCCSSVCALHVLQLRGTQHVYCSDVCSCATVACCCVPCASWRAVAPLHVYPSWQTRGAVVVCGGRAPQRLWQQCACVSSWCGSSGCGVPSSQAMLQCCCGWPPVSRPMHPSDAPAVAVQTSPRHCAARARRVVPTAAGRSRTCHPSENRHMTGTSSIPLPSLAFLELTT